VIAGWSSQGFISPDLKSNGLQERLRGTLLDDAGSQNIGGDVCGNAFAQPVSSYRGNAVPSPRRHGHALFPTDTARTIWQDSSAPIAADAIVRPPHDSGSVKGRLLSIRHRAWHYRRAFPFQGRTRRRCLTPERFTVSRTNDARLGLPHKHPNAQWTQPRACTHYHSIRTGQPGSAASDEQLLHTSPKAEVTFSGALRATKKADSTFVRRTPVGFML